MLKSVQKEKGGRKQERKESREGEGRRKEI